MNVNQPDTSFKLDKILVPVDYSPSSENALKYAFQISEKANSAIEVYHSFFSPAFDLIEMTGNKKTQEKLRKDVTERLRQKEDAKLKTFFEDCCKKYNLPSEVKEKISFFLEAGMPKNNILKYTEESKPDLVIMGTKGTQGLPSTLLGSVTDVVIRKLKIPVVAVPKSFSIEENNSEGKMLYITDFNESDFASVKYLLIFASIFKMSIECIHYSKSSPNQWDEVKMTGLKQYFNDVYHYGKVDCLILEQKKDLIEELEDYMQESDFSLISVTTKRKSTFEKLFKRKSIAKDLFHKAKVPLLVFHQ